MSAGDGASDTERTTGIDVEVPTELFEEIDEEYADRGCASREEAVRHAIQSWIESPVRLSDRARGALETSREQRERGETVPARAVPDRLDLDIDDEAGNDGLEVEYTETALEQLAHLTSTTAKHVVTAVGEASANPRERLAVIPGTAYYELRDGNWQAISTRDRANDRLVVEAVGHRQRLYDRDDRLVGRNQSK